MNNSAMIRAIRVIRDKPMVLLLIVPVQALAVLGFKLFPDFSRLSDSLSEFGPSPDNTFFLSFMVFFLFMLLAYAVAFAAEFLLTPPAMELLQSGAANSETETGWYMRGLKCHWWKPFVSQLILSIPMSIIGMGVYIVSLFVLPLLMIPFMLVASDPTANTQGGALLIGLAMGLGIGGIVSLLAIAVKALFALFLPALAEKGFGDAFKFTFSKAALRQYFRAFGGLLVLAVVPMAIVVIFGASYLLLTGLPDDSQGLASTVFGFFRSWAGVFAMLLASLASVVTYAFEFCLYQKVKEEGPRS